MSLEWLAPVVGILAAAVFAPLMGWMFQGRKTGRGGVASSFLDGFAAAFQPEQHRLQDAKREKRKGGRENSDPPSQE